MRVWSDTSGAFRVDAEFLALKDGKIHIWKSNGVKIAVPVSKMSLNDIQYVEKITGVSLDEDKPLSEIKRRNTQRDSSRSSAKPSNGISTAPESSYDWFDFFLSSGVNPQICERYAQVFSKDQMGEEILPDVTPALLRTLGLKEGDIIRVMKHLDTKFGRANGTPTEGDANGGGLFSGPGGELKNNTRRGRPEPTTQASNVVDADALRQKTTDERPEVPPPAPPKDVKDVGFDDDAWSVKPSKSPAPQSAISQPAATPVSAAPALTPALTGSLGELSLLSPALQPTPTGPPPQAIQAQPTAVPPAQPARPTADAAFFDKLGAPASQNILSQPTGRQRPTAPPLITGNPSLAPPPRASSAPGFQYQQQSGFAPPAPLAAQMTGYQQPMQTGYQAPPGESLQNLQQQQQMQQQQASMYQQNGFAPQQTGYQGMMQPQMTGYYPQQQFQQQPLQMPPTSSPFADPPRQPFQPSPSTFGSVNGMLPPALTPLRTGYTNPNLQPQQTGFPGQQWPQHQQQPQQQQQQQQTPFLMPGQALPPGMTLNANGALVPQQTGFGQQAPQPLVAQKTGPAPPVRFGTTGLTPLMATPTGRRANLSNASECTSF